MPPRLCSGLSAGSELRDHPGSIGLSEIKSVSAAAHKASNLLMMLPALVSLESLTESSAGPEVKWLSEGSTGEKPQ